MNEEFKKLLEGLGALAEMTSIYYKGLIDNNIPAKDAAFITAEFVKAITPKI